MSARLPHAQAASPPPRILVVDPDDDHRELLARNLGRIGHLDACADAEEAASAMGAAPLDLVITDQRLPGTRGLDVLRRASARNPHVGRILLTSYGDTGVTIQAIEGGRVDAYLSKPCLPHQLRLTVAAVLDRVQLSRENEQLLDDLQSKNQALEQALGSLRRAQRRVVDGERLAAISRMCAMIAHDFRGPLAVIRSGAGHLLRGDLEGGEGRELAEQLLAESVRMERMCEEMVAATRASEGRLQQAPVDLDGLLGMSVAVLAEEAGLAGVEVITDFRAGCEMMLDADRVRRAVLNVGYNAIEAMTHGGTLRIQSEQLPAGVRIRLADTGPGVPESLQARVFEPFFTSGKRGGTGLGLAVVKKVVEDHGGALSLGKAEGGGAMLQIDLPSSLITPSEQILAPARAAGG